MKKADNRQHTFWLGYSDLMTSLFFISLVLFVVFYIASQKKQGELEKAKKDAEEKAEVTKKLLKIENDIDTLKKDPDFEYKNNRFELKRQINFSPRSAVIETESDKQYLYKVGKKLLNLVDKLNQENTTVQYMLIIEGMASADGYYDNENLSFQRALAVYNLWNRNDELKSKIKRFNDSRICKFQIVGSGIDAKGWGRLSTTESKEEDQKIVMYIVPYVSYNEMLKKDSTAKTEKRSEARSRR